MFKPWMLIVLFLFVISCTSPTPVSNENAVSSQPADTVPSSEIAAQAAVGERASLPTIPSAQRVQSWTFKEGDETFFSNHLAVSANGAYLVGAGYPSSHPDRESVYLFDYSSNKKIWSYLSAQGVGALAISTEGSTIVIGDDKVSVFGSASNKPFLTLDPYKLENTEEKYNALALTPDAKYLAFAADDNPIVVIDTTTGKEITRVEYDPQDENTEASFVTRLALSPDGKYLVVGGNYAYLYDLHEKKIRWINAGGGSMFGDNNVQSLAISQDSSIIAYNTRDAVSVFTKNSKLWEKKFIELSSSNSQIATLQLSDDGKYLLLAFENNDASSDGGEASIIRLYNAANGDVVWESTLIGTGGPTSLSAQGKYAAVRVDDYERFIYLFDKDFGAKNKPFHIFTDKITGLTNDNDLALSADASSLLFQGDGIEYRQLLPGILIDNTDIVPIYKAGMNVDLRTFVTNPLPQDRELEIEVNAYLPQIAFWEVLGDSFSENGEYRRGSAISSTLSSTLPAGKQILFHKKITLGSQESYDQVQDVPIPLLENPAWLNEIIGELSIFEGLSGMFDVAFDAIDLVVPTNIADGILDELEEISAANTQQGGFYPMLGVGEVVIKDASTGQVYGGEGFMFLYLAQY